MNYILLPRYHLSVVHDGEVESQYKKIQSSQDVFSLLKSFIGDADREKMVSIVLDAKHHVVGIVVVAVGSLTLSVVHPREVFKELVVLNAAAFILAHNHPSGDPTPSSEDRELTRRLKECGDLFGIRLLDHVVIGDGKYVSFADRGWLG